MTAKEVVAAPDVELICEPAALEDIGPGPAAQNDAVDRSPLEGAQVRGRVAGPAALVIRDGRVGAAERRVGHVEPQRDRLRRAAVVREPSRQNTAGERHGRVEHPRSG